MRYGGKRLTAASSILQRHVQLVNIPDLSGIPKPKKDGVRGKHTTKQQPTVVTQPLVPTISHPKHQQA